MLKYYEIVLCMSLHVCIPRVLKHDALSLLFDPPSLVPRQACYVMPVMPPDNFWVDWVVKTECEWLCSLHRM